MQFTECTVRDSAALREVAERAYRETFAPFNTAEDMDKYISTAFAPERLERELKNEASRFIFAMEDGKIVGYIKLNFAPAQTELQDEQSLEVERLYLLGEYQRQGGGKMLMDEAIRFAYEHGKTYIWLGVWEHNEKALRFYEKNGFIRFGSHPFAMGDDVQTDFLMRREIVHPNFN